MEKELKVNEKIRKSELITITFNLFKNNQEKNSLDWAKKNELLKNYTEEFLFMIYNISKLLDKNLPISSNYLFGYQDQENITLAQVIDILYKFMNYLENDQIIYNFTEQIAPIENTNRHLEIQEKINDLSKQHNAVGVSVAYIENGKVIDTYSYGDAIIGVSKMSADTKLRIASLSKAFVGLATMISNENKTISLDDDIGKFWKIQVNTHTPGDVITIRSLLTHTSSLIDVSENNSSTYFNAMKNNLLYGGAIRNIVSGNIQNWNYNNYGFAILGSTIELANNMELGELLKKYLFDPLDIDASFYGGDLKRTDLIANTYYTGGSIGRSAAETKRYFPDGKPVSLGGSFAGGMVISAYDLGKIVAVLANDGEYNGIRILPKNVISNLEYHENNFKDPFWQAQPLRYMTNVYNQDELYYLGGDAYGVHNLIGYNPNTKKGVVVLTSGANFKYDYEVSNTLCAEIARILLNE